MLMSYCKFSLDLGYGWFKNDFKVWELLFIVVQIVVFLVFDVTQLFI